MPALCGGFNRSTQHLLIVSAWEVSDGGECTDMGHAAAAGRALSAMSALPPKADRMGNVILCPVNCHPRAFGAPALGRAADKRQQAAAVIMPATG